MGGAFIDQLDRAIQPCAQAQGMGVLTRTAQSKEARLNFALDFYTFSALSCLKAIGLHRERVAYIKRTGPNFTFSTANCPGTVI